MRISGFLRRFLLYSIPLLPFSYFEPLHFDSDSLTILDAGAKVNGEPISGCTLLLFEPLKLERYFTHFFHLLEHIVGHWDLYGNQHSDDVRLILFVTGKDIQWEGPNEINQHLLNALFPRAEIKTGPTFRQEHRGKTVCFERAVVSDRALTFQSPECLRINKMLGDARFSLSRKATSHLAERVHAYAKTSFQTSAALRVTYLKRPPPRALDPILEEQLLSAIQLLPHVSLRVADFAQCSFQEQVNIVGNTDALVGVHGNGLSHLLFLPPSSKIIEIFPPGCNVLDYCLFADLRDLDYTAISADFGAISKERAYLLGAFGNTDVPIRELNIDAIVSKLARPP